MILWEYVCLCMCMCVFVHVQLLFMLIKVKRESQGLNIMIYKYTLLNDHGPSHIFFVDERFCGKVSICMLQYGIFNGCCFIWYRPVHIWQSLILMIPWMKTTWHIELFFFIHQQLYFPTLLRDYSTIILLCNFGLCFSL